MSTFLWFMASWIIVSVVVALGIGRVMRERLPEEIEHPAGAVITPVPAYARNR